MKNFVIASILFIILILAQPIQATGNFKIVSSFYPVYILAKNIAKDIPNVSVTNLTASFATCLHDYTLTTSDLRKLSEADVLVINGLGMENFILNVAKQYPKLKIIDLSKNVEVIKEKSDVNPHIWLSLKNTEKEIDTLTTNLSTIDPKNKIFYLNNAKKYKHKVESLDQRMILTLKPFNDHFFLSFSDLFLYLAKDLKFKNLETPYAGHETTPSPKDLRSIIDLIKKNKIKFIFADKNKSDYETAKLIAAETKIKIYFLDPALYGSDNLNSYLEIMEQNLKTLLKAYTGNDK